MFCLSRNDLWLLTFGLILMVAMSATGSTSCTLAWYMSPLVSFTQTPLLLATTCALVTMRPSLLMTKPEPFDTGTSLPEKGCLQKNRAVDGKQKLDRNVFFMSKLRSSNAACFPTSMHREMIFIFIFNRKIGKDK